MAVLVLLAHILVTGSFQGSAYWDSLKKENNQNILIGAGKAVVAYIIIDIAAKPNL